MRLRRENTDHIGREEETKYRHRYGREGGEVEQERKKAEDGDEEDTA